MLFYERIKAGEKGSSEGQQDTTSAESNITTNEIVAADTDEDDRHKLKIELSVELADVSLFSFINMFFKVFKYKLLHFRG